jgi:hypothetical protein
MIKRIFSRLVIVGAACTLMMGLLTGVSRADWPYPVYGVTTYVDEDLAMDHNVVAIDALDGRFILTGAFNQDADAHGYNAYQVDWLTQYTTDGTVIVGSRNDNTEFHVAGWLILTYVHRT